MKLSEKIIEFFCKSPVKSFSAMLDALRYLDGDEALGDNDDETLSRTPRTAGKRTSRDNRYRLGIPNCEARERVPHSIAGPLRGP